MISPEERNKIVNERNEKANDFKLPDSIVEYIDTELLYRIPDFDDSHGSISINIERIYYLFNIDISYNNNIDILQHIIVNYSQKGWLIHQIEGRLVFSHYTLEQYSPEILFNTYRYNKNMPNWFKDDDDIVVFTSLIWDNLNRVPITYDKRQGNLVDKHKRPLSLKKYKLVKWWSGQYYLVKKSNGDNESKVN